jgi:hypothetical protein
VPSAETPAPAPPLARVVLPAEHGGWAFLGEPILLGLAVAPSWAGACLAVAAIAGFLARQPLRLFLGDRRRGRRYPRTVLAERAFAALAVSGAAAAAGGFLLARGPVLLALGPAALLGAVALAFDLGLRSREAAAETLAALALGGAAAAVALAAGRPVPLAFALWTLLALRALPTIAFVRARLRLDKGEAANTAGALALHVLALGAGALLARGGHAPSTAVAGLALLAARAAFGVSTWRPRVRAAWLGAGEVAFGLAYVALLAWGFGAGR